MCYDQATATVTERRNGVRGGTANPAMSGSSCQIYRTALVMAASKSGSSKSRCRQDSRRFPRVNLGARRTVECSNEFARAKLTPWRLRGWV